MKKRVKIDSAIVAFFIILTGFLVKFRDIYSESVFLDDILDFAGMFLVLSGTFLRMVSRGYKKTHSRKGHELVTAGPYQLSRNPMYLGSFLLGAGFVFIVWPWWSVLVFACLFYLRFRSQIEKEEEHLQQLFGRTYKAYAHKIPRIFPGLKNLKEIKFSRTFPQDVLWTTKEKRGLWGWLLLAILLESLQEELVFGFTDLSQTVFIFLTAGVVFWATVWGMYRDA